MTCLTPIDVRNARFSGLPAVAKISAPARRASCTAAMPDTAGAGVDQDSLTALQRRQARAAPSGRRSGWSRRLRTSGAGGFATTSTASTVTKVRNVPAAVARTSSPTLNSVTSAPTAHDSAGALASERAGMSFVHADRVEHVAEVQTRRLDGNFHFASSRRTPVAAT